MKPSQITLSLIVVCTFQMAIGCSSRSEAPANARVANTSATPQSVPFSAELWTGFKNGGVKDFQGKIGDKAEVELVVKGSNGPAAHQISVAGYGVYKRTNKPFAISGLVDSRDKSFWVQEFAGKGLEETGTFVGNFTSNSTIDGVWASSKGDTPFSLTEKIDIDKGQLLATVDQVQKKFEALTSDLPSEEDAGSLDDQAVNETRREFDTVYAKCGDSYYSKIWAGRYFSYTQHKDVSFTPAPRGLNEADRLNEVEWAGTVNVARRFLRESYEQGGQKRWGEYRSVAQGTPQHFRARKVKGKWELDDMFPSLRRGPNSKPTCAEIPKD